MLIKLIEEFKPATIEVNVEVEKLAKNTPIME